MASEVRQTINLHGKHRALSGTGYQYYGFRQTFVPGGTSPCRVPFYDESKQIKYDDVRSSPDELVQFHFCGSNIELGRELTLTLAHQAAEEHIEGFDQTRNE